MPARCRGSGPGRGHGPRNLMGTRRNPCPEVSEDSHHSEKHQEHPSGETIPQLVTTLQEILGRLGPRQEEVRQDVDRQEESHQSEHQDREISRYPRRRVVDDQEEMAASHMRDLLRNHPPIFDGSGTIMKVETWLLELSRCFSMHPYRSNTKARCAIMYLREFSSIWWRTKKRKVQLEITTVTRELFVEWFRA